MKNWLPFESRPEFAIARDQVAHGRRGAAHQPDRLQDAGDVAQVLVQPGHELVKQRACQQFLRDADVPLAKLVQPVAARYADIWNWVGLADLDRMRLKHAVFEQRCEEEGRDPDSIVRSAFLSPVVRDTEAEALAFFRTQMTANRLDDRVLDDADIYPVAQDRIIELMVAWKEIGVTSFIVETAAPYDAETIERIAGPVRVAVESA